VIYSPCPSRPLATLVQDALRLPARRLEYRTCAEGGESVYVVEIPRTPRDSMFDALIQLMSIELHWLELWNPAETTTDGAADIVKHWIVPALECCQFRESPVDEVQREIAARMETTKWFFQRAPRPTEAGIYIDDVRQPDDVWTPPTNAPIITGALLRSEWNDVDILYATERHIGRLTWATGA
jgi:hypothetical protein